jgi:FMN phosphatase YigB (HAD superfamily)
MSRKYSAIIFDIGDVLFTWSKSTTTTISPQKVKNIIDHPIWCEFERGEIPAATCYDRLADAFNISSGQEVAEAFEQARASLSQNPLMTELLHQIRQKKGAATEASKDQLALYAMSNISKEDYDFLRGLDAPWHLFDEIFASGYAGMRKPEMQFYAFVLQAIGREGRAGEVIFVDDKVENVEAARAVGLHAVQFNSATEAGAEVRRLLDL